MFWECLFYKKISTAVVAVVVVVGNMMMVMGDGTSHQSVAGGRKIGRKIRVSFHHTADVRVISRYFYSYILS